MKLNKIVLPLALALCATLAATTGCTHKFTGKVTNIPKHEAAPTGGGEANPSTIPNTQPIDTTTPQPVSTPNFMPNPTGTTPTSDINLDNYNLDRQTLAAITVDFKFDSAVVEDSEQANVAAVAQALADANLKLLIEGHCDERGTEEYNRALGERRALALREALARVSIDPMRVKTISYGKDKPVDPGHDEAAWAKNRRGEFILLHPKTPAP